MPVYRPDQLPPPASRTSSFGPVNVADLWTPEPPLSIWRGTQLSAVIEGNPVLIRIATTTPPEPPEWDDPIPVPVGYWSHPGPVGYWQFVCQVAGRPAVVFGAAYAG